jgi:hypothetical protein
VATILSTMTFTLPGCVDEGKQGIWQGNAATRTVLGHHVVRLCVGGVGFGVVRVVFPRMRQGNARRTVSIRFLGGGIRMATSPARVSPRGGVRVPGLDEHRKRKRATVSHRSRPRLSRPAPNARHVRISESKP